MNQREALLRAILEDPADDTVRLVYADWLQENNEVMRAEFIRSQITGSKFAGSHVFWGELSDEFYSCTGNKLRRVKRPTRRCRYTNTKRWMPDGMGVIHAPKEVGKDFERHIDFKFARGFVDWIRTDLNTLLGAGKRKDIAAAVFAAHPVTRVEVVYHTPYESMSGDCQWYDEAQAENSIGRVHPESDLPPRVYSALTGGSVVHRTHRLYITQQDAIDALSRALVAIGRKKAGLKDEYERVTHDGARVLSESDSGMS